MFLHGGGWFDVDGLIPSVHIADSPVLFLPGVGSIFL